MIRAHRIPDGKIFYIQTFNVYPVRTKRPLRAGGMRMSPQVNRQIE
jgi:hypothetical protein